MPFGKYKVKDQEHPTDFQTTSVPYILTISMALTVTRQVSLSYAGGKLPHYAIVCFPRSPLSKLETDKAGSVLSNRPPGERARPGTPALTSAVLEIWIQVAFKTPHSPVHCGRRLA